MNTNDPRFPKPPEPAPQPRRNRRGINNGFDVLALASAVFAGISILLVSPLGIAISVFWTAVWYAASKASNRRAEHRQKMEDLLEEQNRILKENKPPAENSPAAYDMSVTCTETETGSDGEPYPVPVYCSEKPTGKCKHSDTGTS